MHCRLCDDGGHVAPPHCGSMLTRLRVCEPPPQVLVHSGHDGGNAPTAQSRGQQCVLQARTCELCGQAWPPNRGGVLTRVRLL